MGRQPPPLRLRRRSWSPEVAAGLARALGDDLGAIAEQTRRDLCAVWEAPGRGLVVVRREGPELVIVAAEGRDLVPVVAHIMASTTAATVRIHSARPGMNRLIKGLGFRPVETVYRADIHGRQKQ